MAGANTHLPFAIARNLLPFLFPSALSASVAPLGRAGTQEPAMSQQLDDLKDRLQQAEGAYLAVLHDPRIVAADYLAQLRRRVANLQAAVNEQEALAATASQSDISQFANADAPPVLGAYGSGNYERDSSGRFVSDSGWYDSAGYPRKGQYE